MTGREENLRAIKRAAVATATFAVSTCGAPEWLGKDGELYDAVEQAVIKSLCGLNVLPADEVPKI